MVPQGNDSISSMFELCSVIPCSSQIKSLWMTAVISCFWVIWHSRNSVIFEDMFILNFISLRVVLKSMKEVGFCSNSQFELFALRLLFVSLIPRKYVSFVTVAWQPSSQGWMKFNIDGFALGAPWVLGGGSGGGGVFRTCRGFLHGCFASHFGFGFAFETELRSTMYAISFAW